MQNNNKFGIGLAACDQQQQENNCRTPTTNLVTPLASNEAAWSRGLQVPLQVSSSFHDSGSRPSKRHMSYYPSSERVRGFRTIRDEDRDDGYVIAGRNGMVEWRSGRAPGRNDSAFTTISYSAEKQRRIPRAPDQSRWRPVPEREWRRHFPVDVMPESRALPRERPHMVSTLASNTTPTSMITNTPTSMIYQQSSSWSRTVAQVNSFNRQYQQSRSGHGDSHAHNHGQHGRTAQPVQREVRAISMSSSGGSGSSITSPSCHSPEEASRVGAKRLSEALNHSPQPGSPPEMPSLQNKKLKPTPPKMPVKFDMLDMLSTVTMEIGPLQENPSGCSCPKSKCIALYCDCFKAGRRCSPGTCSCLNCKNTIDESGANGARTVAIRTILTRNPRAFTTAGLGPPPKKELPSGQIACNCIRSRCLKLYCGCFQAGNVCDPEVCTCISCLNIKDDTTGQRQSAIQQCLEKRPNAFQVKPREAGMGCACKNNR